MKILVVEDDSTVAESLQILFSSYNYAVDIAEDSEVALHLLQAFTYDLIVLDVVLPKLDGVSLCQQLRAKGSQIPILLLTGQGEARQKAIALNAGADDYVVKPFDAEELIARVQALLRRGDAVTQPILTWENLSVDPSKRTVTYDSHLLSLTPKEYAILELLLRNAEKVLSAKAILDHAWRSVESPGEEVVRVHIKDLRQKLTTVGAPKDLIKTLHRVGYQLNPLYASSAAFPLDPQTAPPLTEINALKKALAEVQEQLQSTQAELQQKHQELEIAQQTLEQELQRGKRDWGSAGCDCSGEA
jgi:DNA-binding response OmpR family regulator